MFELASIVFKIAAGIVLVGGAINLCSLSSALNRYGGGIDTGTLLIYLFVTVFATFQSYVLAKTMDYLIESQDKFMRLGHMIDNRYAELHDLRKQLEAMESKLKALEKTEN